MTEAAQVRTGFLHIGGEERPARGRATYAIASPASGRLVAHVAEAAPDDVDEAVGAARAAFESRAWRSLPPSSRAAALEGLARLIEENEEPLALLDALCAGKPIRDCRAEVRVAAAYFHYYAAAVHHLTGRTIPVDASGLDFTLREPIGVCALITPWNAPLAIAAKKVAPALAAGNSIVLKPAPATPLSSLELERLARQAGVPAGVFNVLTGSSRDLGRTLVRHPGVDKISFTGSTSTGADILRNAADGIKRVNLELGGKSPNVVFADADLDRFVESAVWAVFWNAGQDCCARSRIIVERPVYEQVVRRLSARSSTIRVGDPLDAASEIGSLISSAQRDRVLGYLERAREAGARLHCGGNVVRAPGLEAGNAIAPTVLEAPDPTSEIAREEVFGPVAAVMPFEGEDEAVALANGTEYGLSASLWTRDVGRAIRVGREIRSGLLSINSDSSSHLQAPFGGRGRSGMGKEQGIEGLLEFTELKNVFISDL
jgi:betaine-aldehyde dehydrogenase